MDKRVKFDAATRKWFDEHRLAQTTVARCNQFGLFYKPALGRKCRKEKADG